MAKIFISHSRRDKELIAAIAKVLKNINHQPIIEEFIPEEKKEPVPYEEIRKNVNLSDYIFLFLTDNIVATEYTSNWVMYEASLASDSNKRIFVFERRGVPIPYPIPHLTDYMIFDKDSTNDILDIQTLAKKIDKTAKDVFKGVTIGGLAGSPFGPLGVLIGVLAGGTIAASASEKVLKVKCPHPHCRVSFNSSSPKYSKFKCPSCRAEIYLNLRGI